MSRVIYRVSRVEWPRMEHAYSGHASNSHGTCVGTNVQITLVIHQQLTYRNMLNSVHNCESHSHTVDLKKKLTFRLRSTIVLR